MINQDEAVAIAKGFLEGRPGASGPFSVRAEQDAWIVGAGGEGGEKILVYIDIEDGVPTYLIETVVDIELRLPD